MVWEGWEVERVGAVAGELEFQRYRPRRILASALEDCDIIQVVCGSPAWANAVTGIGKPISLQVATRAQVERRRRDARPKGLVGWWRKAMTEVTDHFDDKALRRVDAIQVENAWMLDYAKKLNRNRDVDIRYAPPGVDTELFKPDERLRRADHAEILCVGRLDDPRKNIELLLEAFAKLPAAVRHRSRLILAGANSPGPAFWTRADMLRLRKSILFVERPSQEELVRLYQRATVFALPSDEEGLGIVILEAMACGVPVVATRCGGPEGIVTDGKDGFLVPRGDSTSMQNRLQEVLDSNWLSRELGRQARAKILSRFSAVVTGRQFINVWDRLLNQKKWH